MVYVQRNQAGEIEAVFETKQDNAQEQISLHAPELMEHLVRSATNADDSIAALSSSDVAMVRVLEDLIATLIDKKVIFFTDFPMAAREKLANRQNIRNHLKTLDDLLAEEQNIL